jgi:hypothetical protein
MSNPLECAMRGYGLFASTMPKADVGAQATLSLGRMVKPWQSGDDAASLMSRRLARRA